MQIERSEIYYTYGVGLYALDRQEEAIANFRLALDLNPCHIGAYTQLARIFYEHGQIDEAFESCRCALDLNPDCAEALYYLGLILQGQGKLVEARDCYRKAAILEPAHAELHYAAMDIWMKADRPDELAELQWLMLSQPYKKRKFLPPRWTGTPLRGKTLLVYTEQGFGDTIQLMRYLPPVKEAAQGTVVLECYPELVDLFGNCDGVDNIVLREVGVLQPSQEFDTQIGIFSLPLLFAGHSVPIPQNVPYLRVPTTAVTKWKKRIASFSGMKVGLRWAGNPKYPADATRSCHLEDFVPLATVSNVAFFSLQKGAREEEAISPPKGMTITDLSSDILDFTDTAAIIANLDLVISTDTCIPHLAGALGRPVWLLLEAKPGGRWHSEGEGCIWYPTMRIFRQSHPGDWSTVLARVAEALQKWADANKVERATGHKQ